jgi:hypothetical protein
VSWESLGVPFTSVYMITRFVLAAVTVLVRREVSKDVELLVLRHENAVLRRHVKRARYQPADRSGYPRWLVDLATVALAEGVIRSRVPDSFHSDLAAQFALEGRVRSTMEALAQIERSINSEMSAIAIRESRTASVTSLSTAVTVPISFLAAFFGLGTSDVSGYSIFDVRHFYYVYLVALLLAAVPLMTTWTGRRMARGTWRTVIDAS